MAASHPVQPGAVMVGVNGTGFAPRTKGTKAMKRLICATLALSLLGATAASAQSFRGGFGHEGGWHGRGDGWHGRGDGGALIGLGIGLFALGAIAAASEHDRYNDRYYDRYDYGPPPPPPAYYGRGYDRGYGY
jgi:hypothetical protein